MNESPGLAEPRSPAGPEAFTEFRPEETEQSLAQRFEQQVDRHGSRLAVKGAGGFLTYTALNEAANRLAHAIIGRIGLGSAPVALLLEHDVPQIVGVLGALKAGKFYVPLDQAQPRPRLSVILDDSQAQLLIADRTTVQAASAIADRRVGVLNLDDLEPGLPTTNLGLAIPPDALACILYTSGSTGRPKGVLQSQRSVLFHIMNHTNCLRTCSDDRHALLAVCTYIGALRDSLVALLNGGSVLPFDLRAEGLHRLASWMAREEITSYNSVATAFRQFAATLSEADQFPRLRSIKLGGETVLRSDIELVRRHFSRQCVVYLVAGATEVGSSLRQLVDQDTLIADDLVPVGDPAPHLEVFLLDEAGRPVADGEIGEIAVRSRYLSPGYWRDPELTAAKFLPDPDGGEVRTYLSGDLGRQLPDGRYVHLGRRDSQVQIRGNRVEIAEVEQALLGLAGVKLAAVVAWPGEAASQSLVAYVVPDPASAPNVRALRAGLRARLPLYMLPAHFVLLDAFPLTSTGKVDRAALPEPGHELSETDQEYLAPRTPLERILVDLWGEVLGLPQVGIRDEFLALGGDSLLATRLIARIRAVVGIEVSLVSLLGAGTIADQALVILEHQAASLGSSAVSGLLEAIDGVSTAEPGRLARTEAY